MPKITDGKTSDDRKHAIREVLGQYGKMSRDDLFQKVAQKLNVDLKSIRSSLYKDLNTLSDKSVLEKQYLHPDDTPMTDEEINDLMLDDSSQSSNYKLIWSLKGYEDSVIGAKLLEDLGGKIYVPNKSMLRDFEIMDATKSTQLGSYSIIFEIGNRVLKLGVDENARPVTIVVGRSNTDASFVYPKNELLEEFGKRTILLLLPNRLLSAGKEGSRLGHFLMTLSNKRDELLVRDLGSKNGTKTMRLSKDDAALVDIRLNSYPGETSSIPLVEATFSEADSRSATNEAVSEQLPCMVFVPGGFGIFVR